MWEMSFYTSLDNVCFFPSMQLLDDVSTPLKDIPQTFSPKVAQSPLAHEEIVSINIMEVLIICFVVVGLSFATKMKWDTQTKLIIITGAFRA